MLFGAIFKTKTNKKSNLFLRLGKKPDMMRNIYGILLKFKHIDLFFNEFLIE